MLNRLSTGVGLVVPHDDHRPGDLVEVDVAVDDVDHQDAEVVDSDDQVVVVGLDLSGLEDERSCS